MRNTERQETYLFLGNLFGNIDTFLARDLLGNLDRNKVIVK